MRALLLMCVLALGVPTAARSAEAGGVRLFARHEVSDYATWRKAYDGFGAFRRQMGVTAQAVYRSQDNPNDVTVTHDFKTAQEARAFAGSPELKATMEKAGVSGVPQIWITTSPGGRPAEPGVVRMFVHHPVTDYAAWRKVYDAFDATRRKMGVTTKAVFQSVDDPNDVTGTHDFKTLKAAKAFAASSELKAAMEKAGVAGSPQIWFTTRASR
jgi:hypothetical protein